MVTALALLINTAGIGLRWVESYQMGIGYAPLSNMYESLVFFSWSIAIFYLGLEYKYKGSCWIPGSYHLTTIQTVGFITKSQRATPITALVYLVLYQ